MTQTAIEDLKVTWALLFPEVAAPADQQWALWLLLHDGATVRAGVAQLAAKYRRTDGRMDDGFMVRFASSVMNRMMREQKGAN